MPIANPLTNGGGFSAGLNNGNYDQAQTPRRGPDPGGSPSVGSGDLTGAHNTPLHCAGLVLVALAVIFGLRLLGFQFSTAAKVG